MVETSIEKTVPSPVTRKWWPWVIGLGITWGLIIMVIIAISEPTPENIALAISIWFAGGYTLFLRIIRRLWMPLFSTNPMRGAVIVGALNAAFIETEFLIFGKLFDAVSIAAHPNLIVDLLMTMPWYIMMVYTFVKVQNRWRFSAATVLFLGGIYEMGGDGIAGSLFEMMNGNFQLLTLEYWIMMLLIYVWAFIPVYSSMVLPSAWLLNVNPAEALPSGKAWRAALKPMLWLIPFTVYLLLVLFVITAISG